MKNLFKYISLILVLVAFWGCQEEEPELGSPIAASELDFDIYQDANDPNMVVLESRTPNVIPFWTTPSGRSTSVTDTVRLAFPGTYKFVYSVQSRGGLVSADTTIINITTSNLSYVDDPLYNLITGGGPGNSKTWLLDLDEEGVSKYFIGPMYFLGSEVGYGEECLVEDGDCWDYKPDWQGNQWVATLGDYGSMTFGLENNATLVANHNMIPARGQESGVFEINTDTYTLSTSDATPLHTPNYEDCVDNWGQARIISLTENTMQLGFFRKESCESVALLVFNYISEEYAENWVPEDQGEPEPDLPDDWQDDVNQQVNTELTWVLSPETPFNYANLDGTLMNPSWISPADYPEWTGYTADLAANFAEFSLTFNSADSTALYTDPSGNENEGSYVLSENGIYTFEGIDPNFNITPGTSFAPTAENQLRILQIEYDNEGKVSGMWVGARSTEKPEYLAYHLVLQGDAPADPLRAWKNALVGKTFIPDINWFINFVGVAPGFAGGWTNSDTFGDDYTQDWVYDESTREIAETASIMFFMDGDQMKVTVSQTLITEHQDGENWVTDDTNTEYSVTGNVNIDPEEGILSIDVPLIDYAGSAARWLQTNGTDNSGDWFFVPHGGSTLSTINSAGLWLGYTTPDKPTETTIFHYIVAN